MSDNKKIDSMKMKAHEIATNDFGAKDAQEFIDKTNLDINSGNATVRQSGLQRAAEFTKKLTLLMLYQEIDNTGDGLNSKYDWINKFNAGRISQGNSKQWIKQIPTGYETYNSDEFNPTKKSLPMNDSTIASMYERNAQNIDSLSSKAYQFNKPLTIQANEWLPYFKDGNLSAYISNLISYMRECYNMFIINKLHNVIKNLNPVKQVNINTTDVNENNLFLAMVNDIIPIIENFKYLNTEYNYEQDRGALYSVKAENILVFCNYKILLKLRSGVMSRVFHAKMIDPTNFIPDGNWIGLNKDINVPQNSNQKITTSNDDVLNEQTMFIFDKNLIKHLVQVEETGNQGYITNMTIQHNLHIWGLIDIIPWIKCVKYTNVNLSKQPN